MQARMRIKSAKGERVVAASEFFQGLLTTDIQVDEMLVEIAFPAQSPWRGTCWKWLAWAHKRHSDNEKFCNDLNGPKTPRMSERLLKTLQYFETSKLNTSGTLRPLFKRRPVASVGLGGRLPL